MKDSKTSVGATIRFTIIAVLIIALLIALMVWQWEEPTIVKLVPVQAPIPSQRDIQQRLTDLGKARYDPGKIDGVIGKASRIAWDNYICDQFAKVEFEGESK